MGPKLHILGLGVVLLAVGCTAGRRTCAPKQLSRESGLLQPVPADDSAPTEAELLRSFGERPHASNYPANALARPGKFLALSGGGQNGAYTVGVLSGWSDTGTRPQFDVVTGVSTGALIATHAFLGKEYDAPLVRLYTSVSDRDIYRRRPIPAMLWSDSAASSAPLKKLIDAHIDDELLTCVARAHAAGRRLYIGTTNIDTRRLVIWDMGAIASSGRSDAKDLYRKIVLASASVPGFFPPVPIEVEVNGRTFTEMHVDGGATTGLFFRTSTLHIDPAALKANPQALAGSDVYVIIAGKLYADPACTERRTVKIAESSLNSLVYSQTRGELFRIYTLCRLGGMNYHLAAIPEAFRLEVNAMGFDPEEMRRLYRAGHAAATGGEIWKNLPPGGEPHEEARPRTGTQFLAPTEAPR